MKNKSVNNELVPEWQDVEPTKVIANPALAVDYLNKVSIKEIIGDDAQQKLYEFVRTDTLSRLPDSQKTNPVILCIVERIARTFIYLDKFDRLLGSAPANEDMSTMKLCNKSMLDFLEEHRKWVELLSNVSYAESKGKKGRVLERLREIVYDTPIDSNGTTT